MKEQKFWSRFSSFAEAEKKWDERAKAAEQKNPLRVLKTLPQVPGITEEAAKNLKWKSLKWMIQEDEKWEVTKYILKRPFTHFFRFITSFFQKKSYTREGDFFFYGLSSIDEMKEGLKRDDTVLLVGFSYCEKPHECPSGRFTDVCIHDLDNLVCQQCFIGKAVHALPEERTVAVFIPTIHYIGKKIFETMERFPDKKLYFLITACEMTLEMFGDYGNMAGIKGIGVRLDGRICNTMKAFELSEKGIKPGLTILLDETKSRFLDLLSHWKKCQQ